MVSALGTDGPDAGLTAFDLVAQALSGLLLADARPGDAASRAAPAASRWPTSPRACSPRSPSSRAWSAAGGRRRASRSRCSARRSRCRRSASSPWAASRAAAAAGPATPGRHRGARRGRAGVGGPRALLPRLPRRGRLLRAHLPQRGPAPGDARRARPRGPVRGQPAGGAGVRGRARGAAPPGRALRGAARRRRPPPTGSAGCAPPACRPPRCGRSSGSTRTRRRARTGSCRRSTRRAWTASGCSAAIFKVDGAPAAARRGVPGLGEHTAEVLDALAADRLTTPPNDDEIR